MLEDEPVRFIELTTKQYSSLERIFHSAAFIWGMAGALMTSLGSIELLEHQWTKGSEDMIIGLGSVAISYAWSNLKTD